MRRETEGLGVPLTLHPVFIAAVLGLVVNDHYLKRIYESWFTGKASDALGALILTVVLAVVISATRRTRLDRTAMFVTASVVVAGIAVVKTSTAGACLGGMLLGLFRWPFRLMSSAVQGGGLPAFAPVAVVADATDAIAALCAFGAILLVPRDARSDGSAPGPQPTTTLVAHRRSGRLPGRKPQRFATRTRGATDRDQNPGRT